MNLYPLILRVLHIGSAVFWAGASWSLAGFLSPAVREVQNGGPAVMKYIIRQRRLSDFLGISALLTVGSGLLLYWRQFPGLNSGWLTSGPGISLTIGSVAGLIAFVLGFFVNRPLTKEIGEIGNQLEASRGPPDPALVQRMGQLQDRLEQAGIWISILLAIAVVTMASAEQAVF
ncbi:MAG: hypothetical protein ACLFWD_09525 [Anaerolineales bacterium]